ncbi:hypothetical protein EDD80_10133 [Anseongella ginsenosidimutans]|uniref:DUF4382 domain-containing protein n=1 Tax=Anseongella ginsenosidimutans TaxID=496056 RepID=A0A4R3KXW0_9SPHI|nr:hypothetical protein [Anseongella ginsenosidimutans]QEC51456.1 hypothetical protein FRZ59_03200 [Anseongella ginsenosidimutans]TCS89836.1 hypothetical protein EDD80_10133 [Anseongella ginsenosidimutans]
MVKLFARSCLLLILLLPGCEKQEFTEPAPFELEFSATGTPVMEGRLGFGDITMHPEKIEIEGIRSAGDDVFFERDLKAGALTLGQHPVLHFDLPQGIYNRLTINLSFEPDEEKEEEFEEELGDLLEDLQGGVLSPIAEAALGELILDYREGEPGFLYSGTYKHGQEEFELLLVINNPFVLNLTATNTSGSREIVLEKGKDNRAALYFDIEKWFSIVPAQLVEKSPKGTANGKTYVLIHKKLNPGLFNMLYNRIEQFTTLVVNE